MNLKKIKEVLDNELLTEAQQSIEIYKILAEDRAAIGIIMNILDVERNNNKALISDMNLLLSKVHVIMDEPKLNTDNFVNKEIKAFYSSGRIDHLFPKQK